MEITEPDVIAVLQDYTGVEVSIECVLFKERPGDRTKLCVVSMSDELVVAGINRLFEGVKLGSSFVKWIPPMRKTR